MVRTTSRPSRRFCFTLFAGDAIPADEHEANLTACATTWTTGDPPSRCRFLVCQLERCPDTQRLHLQGYVEVTTPCRFSWLHRVLDPRLRLEESKGNAEQNVVYCTKEDSRVSGPWTLGTPATQGQRTDLESLQASVQQGDSTAKLWDQHFPTMVRYYKGVREYQSVRARAPTLECPAGFEPPLAAIEVNVYWGDTGCGKTRRAVYESHNPFFATVTNDGKLWFDGYEPGQDIIIDEFAGECPINMLKRILDIYHYELPVKGAMVPRQCRRITLTSNTNPADWYDQASQTDKDAVRRRFSQVIHFTALLPWTPPADDQEIVPGTQFE